MQPHHLSGWSQVVYGLFEVVLAVVVASKSLRRFHVRDVNSWAWRHGVAIDGVTGPYVNDRLTRGRRIRTLCFLVPFAAEALVRLVGGLYRVRGGDWDPGTLAGFLDGIAILGYFGGAVLAELTSRPQWAQADEPRAAMALARDLSAYLPSWVKPLQWGAAGGAVVLIPVALVFGGSGGLRPVAVAASALIAVAVTVVTELARRQIIGRRQAVMAPERLALDDAMRATAVHVVSGAGILLAVLQLSAQINHIGPADPTGDLAIFVSTVVGLVASFTWLAGVLLWLQLLQPSWWAVRRLPVPA